MMRSLLLLSTLTLAALAQEKAQPGIEPEITIAHLNKVIEAQAVHILSLQAQLDEEHKGRALSGEIRDGIAKMQAVCAAQDAALAMNQQTGLYLPDEKGMPRCVPNPAKPDAKPAAKQKEQK